MKRTLKFMSVLMFICLGFFMLSGASSAQEKINLQLKKKADSIVLVWNGSKKESYTVYKKTGEGKFIKTDKVKGKKYTDKNVKSGEAYTYCVKKNKKVKSEYKAAVYLAPAVMKKTGISNAGITLKWNVAEGAEAYVVYRKQEKGENKRLGKTAETFFTDTTAEKGVIYTYSVKSAKDKNVSTAVSVKAGKLESPALTSLEKSAEGLILSWKKIDPAKEYIVYRKDFGGNKWKKVGKTDSLHLTFEDKTAKDGEKYSYFVKAKAGDSISLYEGECLSATCMKSPETFNLKVDGKKMKLTWDKKEDADKYQIYKKTGDGKWKKLKETDKLTFTDKIKSSKAFVSYKVRAMVGKSKTAFSHVVSNRDVDPKKPMVALTYDDGPHPVNTHRILDALEKHGARATFFVVGSRITSYKDCIERQAKLGCEIANHSFSHATLSVSKDKTVLEEIKKTDNLIEKYSGQTPVLCRAPGGSVGKAASLLDRPFIHWSVDTLDWQSRSASKVVSHIKRTVRDGSIILMHDLYGSTAEASEIIIPWLISEGYQLVTVSELLEARGIEPKGGKVYYNGYAK